MRQPDLVDLHADTHTRVRESANERRQRVREQFTVAIEHYERFVRDAEEAHGVRLRDQAAWRSNPDTMPDPEIIPEMFVYPEGQYPFTGNATAGSGLSARAVSQLYIKSSGCHIDLQCVEGVPTIQFTSVTQNTRL